MGYVQIEGYVEVMGYILDEVFKGRETPVEVIDVCAGNGSFLKGILADERINSTPVKYTAVETQREHVDTIKVIWDAHEGIAKGSKGGVACKEFEEYLTSSPETKRGKFDVVFCGFGIHTFPPKLYLDCLQGIYEIMKPGGKFFMTQHSYSGDGYSDLYSLAVGQEMMLPFWVDREFSSDPKSMARLMTAFGFVVEQCTLHTQLHINERKTTKYLYIQARKPEEDTRDEGLMSQSYEDATKLAKYLG